MRQVGRPSWSIRGIVVLVFVVATGALALASTALAADITSAGPLTTISISTDLNCAVNHTGDSAGEWFGDTACGTLVVDLSTSTLYGPAAIPAGGSAAPRTTYTAVSQTGPTGSGTAGDPYKVVTVNTLGTSGLTLTQTDSYVVGQESYRTDVTISNSNTSARSVRLYAAGDCFLQSSDFGFGRVDGSAISCTVSQDPGSRIEQLFPLTSGSHYYETFYNTMWAKIGAQAAAPDTCDCATDEDNSILLSWDESVPASGSVTVSHITTFSPLGFQPLTTTKVADSSTVAAGGSDGYTIKIHNPNASDVTVDSITDTLPAGFSYTAGSSTGATTSNPTISGQTLTWSGSFNDTAGGDVTLHFNVTAATAANTYFNNAGGDAGAVAVVPTGDTAPVTVQSATPATTLTVIPAAGDFADPTTVSAILTATATATPLAAQTVTLTLNATETCSGTTDVSGKASCSITPGEAAGTYTLAGSFAATPSFQGSTGSASFVVTHEETAIAYTGPTSAVNGQPLTLSGHLTTDDPAAGTGLGGRTITLTLGTGGTAQTCTVVTMPSGDGSCTIASVSQSVGVVAVAAAFAGDTFYVSALDTSSVNVFNPTATGAFVIGDRSAGSPTVGKTVNFWGAQWAKNNSFSGGSAPSSMKGFADSPTSLTCGGTWKSRPGDSSDPPPTIPSVVNVIVATKVTKSGSTISGNIVHIVAVQVSPGYGPDPGHAGNGKILSTIC